MRWVALLGLLTPAVVRADPGRLLDDHTFDTEPGGPFITDAGFVIAKPTSLPTGISTGVGAGFTRRCGCLLSYGARVAWSRVREPGQTWIVTQDDFRFRAVGAIRHDVGRGSIALRLAAGPTVVHEVRDRQQGMRDPGANTVLQTRAVRALPAGEAELVVSLKIAGDWLVTAGGGPSLAIDDGATVGWISELGVAWQP
jgi:hypothetical protein